MTRRSNVVSERNVRWAEHSHGEKFGYRRKSLSSAAGGEKLGCSLYEVPPGRRAWPYHYHSANEEAIYVLEGSGTLRVNGEEVPVFEKTTPRSPPGQKAERSPVSTRRRGPTLEAISPTADSSTR